MLILVGLFIGGLLLNEGFAAVVMGSLVWVELTAAVAVFGLAIYGAWRLRLRRQRATQAVRRAAENDEYWNEARLIEVVRNLYDVYWRAVASGNTASLHGRLSPYWSEQVTQALQDWRASKSRAVLLDLALGKVSVVGLEDWLADCRDQVTLCIEATNSFHVTHLPTGELVEGNALARQQKELWQFVRGETGWLLNRIRILAEGVAVPDYPIVREER